MTYIVVRSLVVGPEVRFWRLASTASAWTWKQATATLNQSMNK